MPRYIDAERFKLWILENYVLYDGGRYLKDIDEQPTVDVVEVVRCKDCKDARRVRNGVYHCPYDNKDHIGGFYCAYGERRGDRNDN